MTSLLAIFIFLLRFVLIDTLIVYCVLSLINRHTRFIKNLQDQYEIVSNFIIVSLLYGMIMCTFSKYQATFVPCSISRDTIIIEGFSLSIMKNLIRQFSSKEPFCQFVILACQLWSYAKLIVYAV